ncbi:MAG TPA: hypothetical protein VGL06_03135 [Pseudonocardiaceae bacterium]|jgi:hypothetical protein
MENSLDALRAQVRYRQHDLAVEADQARLARAVRSRPGPWLFTRRDARRLHAEVAAFVAGAAPADQRPIETTSAGTRCR